jgi:V/A-type H+-transporting ATPase subunit I
MPSQDVLLIMGIAAVIGALFQLGSILIGFYASLKSGDKAGAYFDRLAWLVFLIGGLVFLATLFFPGLPAAVRIAGLVLCGAGFLTILLFAGRDSKSIVGRIAVGVISFYGIVGYYGVVSFFGDVLSYLRLAILNLTGGYIAFVANTIGQLLRGGGGIIVAALMTVISLVPILFFHVLNLVLSMQGSFVHSLRLNYLESFSRYYGTGGKAFSPLKKEGRYYRFEE